jgi:hypothetical protein
MMTVVLGPRLAIIEVVEKIVQTRQNKQDNVCIARQGNERKASPINAETRQGYSNNAMSTFHRRRQ